MNISKSAGIPHACKIGFQNLRAFRMPAKSVFKVCGHFACLQNRFLKSAGIPYTCKIDF